MTPQEATLITNDLSSEYFDRALRITPGGVHSPVRAFKSVGGTPVFFRSAQGATMTSVDGREYTDFCQSFGPLMLGHRDPDVSEAEMAGTYRVLTLEALVRIKLTAFRDKDRTHLRDLLEVGLIDAGWKPRFPPELGERLQQLLDTPGG